MPCRYPHPGFVSRATPAATHSSRRARSHVALRPVMVDARFSGTHSSRLHSGVSSAAAARVPRSFAPASSP